MSEKKSKLNDFFSSPIKIGDNGKEYSIDRTSLQMIEARTLQKLVAESNAKRTLEIGLALGSSAVAIAEMLEKGNGDVHHIALDPFQADFGNVALRELERLGLRHLVEFRAEPSEEFLPHAVKSGLRFDLILDDGSRTIGQKVTNTFFGDRCLNPTGILVFHDAFIPSAAASIRYLLQERGYELIKLVPDSHWKRWLRALKYWRVHGFWYAFRVVPCSCRSLVAVRKTAKSAGA
jgi:predicted O-methyltransferase YrrM